MNKKQLMVAWIAVIIMVMICLSPAVYYVGSGRGRLERIDFVKTIFYIFSVVLPGVLLIYTLRDKK